MKWAIVLLCLCMPSVSFAQSVTNLKAKPNGDFSLQIDENKYIAIRETEYDKIINVVNSLKTQLTTANKKLKESMANSAEYEALRNEYKSLTNSYKKQTDELININTNYARTSRKLIALNNEYSLTLRKFDALVEKYRDVALRSTPRNPVDIGFGVLSINDENKGVFMFGAGTDIFGSNLRGWLYGGEDTYGAMLGMSF